MMHLKSSTVPFHHQYIDAVITNIKHWITDMITTFVILIIITTIIICVENH